MPAYHEAMIWYCQPTMGLIITTLHWPVVLVCARPQNVCPEVEDAGTFVTGSQAVPASLT